MNCEYDLLITSFEVHSDYGHHKIHFIVEENRKNLLFDFCDLSC